VPTTRLLTCRLKSFAQLLGRIYPTADSYLEPIPHLWVKDRDRSFTVKETQTCTLNLCRVNCINKSVLNDHVSIVFFYYSRKMRIISTFMCRIRTHSLFRLLRQDSKKRVDWCYAYSVQPNSLAASWNASTSTVRVLPHTFGQTRMCTGENARAVIVLFFQ
jgi:hypothetical protein